MEPLLADPATRTPAAGRRATRCAGRPEPLHGGPLALARFMRANHMLSFSYARLLTRYALLKLRYRRRLQTDGICFICPGVRLEIGAHGDTSDRPLGVDRARLKIRVHEGEVSVGAKTVMGQECTISAYQNVSIGRECIIADRVMLIDFDHGVVEVDRPIREQGIYKRDVDVGHNVWIGYGACVLRGVSIGSNSIVGTNAVVTKDVPENAVVGGVPARTIRMRDAPALDALAVSAQRREQRRAIGVHGEVARAGRPRRGSALASARASASTVALEPLAPVRRRAAAGDHERPVARLQREQLAHRGGARARAGRGQDLAARPRAP